ncbi:MAG: hypothetical protein WBE34_19500 [Candidatus Nitrosopolaris sp.]
MVETALPTKTKIKRKTTTMAAMIVIATIIAFPLAANKIAFAAVATITPTAVPTMLKLTTAQAPVVIPLVKGLYDGKDILLITTEVSDKAMKDQIGNFTGSPVNYEPNLTKSQDIGNLWIFKNGVKGPGFMGFQASVVDSIPGDSHYTPLWKVSIVDWKTTSGTTPTILGSDDAIAQAAGKGQITITPTKVVVNCPILQWGGNKDNTIPAGHI